MAALADRAGGRMAGGALQLSRYLRGRGLLRLEVLLQLCLGVAHRAERTALAGAHADEGVLAALDAAARGCELAALRSDHGDRLLGALLQRLEQLLLLLRLRLQHLDAVDDLR